MAKISRIFRDAAARIHTYNEVIEEADKIGLTSKPSRAYCCCAAVDQAAYSLRGTWQQRQAHADRAHNFFHTHFHPGVSRPYWWRHPANTSKDQEARRLALLMAADMAESMGD